MEFVGKRRAEKPPSNKMETEKFRTIKNKQCRKVYETVTRIKENIVLVLKFSLCFSFP